MKSRIKVKGQQMKISYDGMRYVKREHYTVLRRWIYVSNLYYEVKNVNDRMSKEKKYKNECWAFMMYIGITDGDDKIAWTNKI